MLPALNDRGVLPAGRHLCSEAELAATFGHGSPEREVEMNELRRFIGWCRRTGVRRLLINGSFVTAKIDPIDVDVVILPKPGVVASELPPKSEDLVWPFLQVQVAVDENDFDLWARVDFAIDHRGIPKGTVEIKL